MTPTPRPDGPPRTAMNVRFGTLAAFTAALTTCALPGGARGGDDGAKAAPGAFETTRVWSVHVTLPAKEYEAMQPVTPALFGFLKPPPKPPGAPGRQVHRNAFGVDLAWATGDI